MRLAPDRVAAINDGRTKAIERAIGAEMRFAQGIATVLSTDQLPSALTCTLSPMEGDASMWSRIAAAADLAFGARAMLRLRINDEKQPPERPNSDMHTIVTDKINVVRGDQDINPKLPVEMEEVANPDSETKRGGTIRFICRQNRARVGMVEVSYLYVPKRKIKEDDIPPERRKLALDAKDTPLPPAADERTLRDVLGISFELAAEKKKEGFDAKYTPYPHCLNYWGSAHGSGLVAFATMGIPEAANGFTVKYHNPAIGEFDPSDPQKASTKAFYRRREGNRVEVRDEEGKLLISVEFVDAPPRMPDPDGEMVVRMKGKDQEAWEEFERKYGRKMRSAMKRKFPAKADVEGEYGEFVMQLWQAKLASFDPERGLFSHWLLRCLTYHIIDRLRAMGRRAPESSLDAPLVEGHEGGATFSEMLGEYEDPEQILLREEFRTQVRAALSKLKEEHREPIEKVYLDGMSYAEAATELGLSIGQIKSRIYNGKIELQHRLRQKRKIGRL